MRGRRTVGHGCHYRRVGEAQMREIDAQSQRRVDAELDGDLPTTELTPEEFAAYNAAVAAAFSDALESVDLRRHLREQGRGDVVEWSDGKVRYTPLDDRYGRGAVTPPTTRPSVDV